MIRRHPALLAALAAALVLAARPTVARANSVANYRITNTGATGSAPVSEIAAYAIPPGSLFEPPPATSPLKILPGSSGFDQSPGALEVGIGDTKPGVTPQLQVLDLKFGNGGFAPGGVLNFSLLLTNVGQGPPQLSLQAPSSGIVIDQVPDATPTPPPNTTPTPNVHKLPEPMSVVVWSTLAGLGLLRARRFRRV